MIVVGNRVQHIASGKFGGVYHVDPGSASTPGDQVIGVKFDDGTSIGAAAASEFEVVE